MARKPQSAAEYRNDGGQSAARSDHFAEIIRPELLVVVGICEECAAKNDATLSREGFAELRKAFPNMPEFKVHAVQEGSENVN